MTAVEIKHHTVGTDELGPQSESSHMQITAGRTITALCSKKPCGNGMSKVDNPFKPDFATVSHLAFTYISSPLNRYTEL